MHQNVSVQESNFEETCRRLPPDGVGDQVGRGHDVHHPRVAGDGRDAGARGVRPGRRRKGNYGESGRREGWWEGERKELGGRERKRENQIAKEEKRQGESGWRAEE